MWETEPNWADAQLQSIRAPVLVADGDRDEAIKRAHTGYIAATIAGAGLLILPNTSHLSFLQDATLFNVELLHLLGDSEIRCQARSSSKSVLASLRSSVSKPSVNQP
jgi:pimeloyl-ACP methyl ester carboxylesterase